jgi:hypothetical protein
MITVFIRLISLLIIILILSIRNDGYFPLNISTSEDVNLLFSSFSVVIIFILAYVFFRPEILAKPVQSVFLMCQKHSLMLIIVVALILILITLGLLYKSSLNYIEYGDLSLFTIIVCSITLGLLISLPLLLKKASFALLSLSASGVLMFLIPIINFPITAKIGDLMPIIQKQTAALLSGTNLYQYFLLDNGVFTQSVRQPGISFFYLPAEIFKFDYRFMQILFFLVFTFIFLRIAYKKFSDISFDYKFLVVYTTLMLITLMPYRIIRWDLYDYPVWVLIAGIVFLLKKQSPLKASLLLGIGIFTQVWFWIFTPFILLYIYRNYSKPTSLKSMLISVLAGIGLIFAVIKNDVSGYIHHAFGFYSDYIKSGGFVSNSFYLTPWFIKLSLSKFLLSTQLLLSAGLFILGILKIKSLKSLLLTLSLVFLVFIQLNSLTWNYFYINLIILMALYLVLSLENYFLD